MCTRCSQWVYSRCSGLRTVEPTAPTPPLSPTHTPIMSDKTFNILQWHANGIGNNQTEICIFLEAHNVKVAAIQESGLTTQSRSPNIRNCTLVRQDRRLGQDGGLLFLSITQSASLASYCQQRRIMTPT